MDNILEKINTSALKFLSPLTPEETYQIIVSEAEKLIGADYGSIILEENGELKRVYASHDVAFETKNRKKANTYKAFSEQQVIVASIDDTGKAHPELIEQGIKWSIFIPLSYEQKSIGVLILNAKEDTTLDPSEIHVLKLFGAMASLAIRKNQLYAETKNALETRDLFISLASHELRTPLTSLNGYIQLLHTRLGKGTSVEAKWINELYEESKRLTNLVTELLEVNRIKQGQLQFHLTECQIDTIIVTAVERYKIVNPEKEVTVTSECAEGTNTIIGDPEKLLQMITALISNADKFSPKNTKIEITTKQTKSQAIIEIKDQGDGISRQNIKRIFDPFYKGENAKEGLGVGLLLAKHIITYHHGAINVKSKVNKGTTVEVRFPLFK